MMMTLTYLLTYQCSVLSETFWFRKHMADDGSDDDNDDADAEKKAKKASGAAHCRCDEVQVGR